MDNKLKELNRTLALAEDELRKHKAVPEHERGKTYSWWYHRSVQAVSSAKKAVIAYQLDARKIPGILKAAGLPIAKRHSTAIKGHYDYEYGFWTHTDLEGVWVYTQRQGYESLGTFKDVSNLQRWVALGALSAAGYIVELQGGAIRVVGKEEV